MLVSWFALGVCLLIEILVLQCLTVDYLVVCFV